MSRQTQIIWAILTLIGFIISFKAEIETIHSIKCLRAGVIVVAQDIIKPNLSEHQRDVLVSKTLDKLARC